MDQQQLDFCKEKFRFAFAEAVQNNVIQGKEVNHLFKILYGSGFLNDIDHVAYDAIDKYEAKTSLIEGMQNGCRNLLIKTNNHVVFRLKYFIMTVLVVHPVLKTGKVFVKQDKDGPVYTGYVLIEGNPIGFAFKPSAYGFTPYVRTKDQNVRSEAIPMILNLVHEFTIIEGLPSIYAQKAI